MLFSCCCLAEVICLSSDRLRVTRQVMKIISFFYRNIIVSSKPTINEWLFDKKNASVLQVIKNTLGLTHRRKLQLSMSNDH